MMDAVSSQRGSGNAMMAAIDRGKPPDLYCRPELDLLHIRQSWMLIVNTTTSVTTTPFLKWTLTQLTL